MFDLPAQTSPLPATLCAGSAPRSTAHRTPFWAIWQPTILGQPFFPPRVDFFASVSHLRAALLGAPPRLRGLICTSLRADTFTTLRVWALSLALREGVFLRGLTPDLSWFHGCFLASSSAYWFCVYFSLRVSRAFLAFSCGSLVMCKQNAAAYSENTRKTQQ